MTRALALSSLLLLACASAPKPAGVTVGPPASTRAQASLPPLQPPVLKLSTEVTLGAVQRGKLKNAIEYVLVPRHEVPSVDVLIAIRAGGNADPLDKAGLAQFTASMLRKGTKARSADAIAETIDNVGGDLDASAADEEIVISCRARARDLELCLELAADIARNPTFPAAEMDEVREQLKGSVEGMKDSPGALANAHGANVFFGDADPRGRSLSLASLAALDRAALIAFHKRYFGPTNTFITIAGDFDPAAVERSLDRRFGNWVAKTATPPAKPSMPATPSRMRVRLVDKPDATQSTMVLVGTGLAHKDPDYFAVLAMNYTLGGGGFSSRLMKAVRSEGGKTYGASSSFSVGRDSGTFTASTFTRNAETTNTLKLVLDEIQRMRQSGSKAEELDAAKKKLIGGYGLKLETGSDLARSLLRAELHGLSRDYLTTYPANLDKVSLADTARVAARFLQPTALVIVGKAEEVRPLLDKVGLIVDEVVGYKQPVSASERKPEGASALPKGVVPMPDSAHVLADARNAKGNAAAIAKIKDLTARAEGTITARDTAVPVKVVEKTILGRASYSEIDLGMMTMVQAISDGKGFIKQGPQKQPLPPDVATQMMRALARDPSYVLTYATQPKVRVSALARDKQRGLQIIGPDGDVTFVWFDPKTFQISEVSYREDGKDARDEYDDYRVVDGVKMPFAARRFLGDGSKMELRYSEVRANQGVPASLFTP